MVREGLLQDPGGLLDGDGQGDHQRLPEAGQEAPSRHQPRQEETFKEISAAYDVLGDADRRKEYDEVRAMGPPPAVSAAASPVGSVAPVAGAPTGSKTSAISATCSAACSAGAGGAAGPPRRPTGGRRRDRAPPLVRGRRQRGDHVGQPDLRCPLPHLCGHRCRTGHPAGDLSALRRFGHPPGQPGPLLPEPDLPRSAAGGGRW